MLHIVAVLWPHCISQARSKGQKPLEGGCPPCSLTCVTAGTVSQCPAAPQVRTQIAGGILKTHSENSVILTLLKPCPRLIDLIKLDMGKKPDYPFRAKMPSEPRRLPGHT